MSDHPPADLSRTIAELMPRHRETWHSFTKTSAIVSVLVAVLLLLLLLVFVIL